MTAQQINDALESAPPRRTLQYRLKSLVDSRRLIMEGTAGGHATRVSREISVTGHAVTGSPTASARAEVLPPLSEPGVEIQGYVSQPLMARKPVGYARTFLDSYRPTIPSISRKRIEVSSRRSASRRSPNSPPGPMPSRF